MGRRKKQPSAVHRKNIASKAQELFMKNGIASTSMDAIAKNAGYSKATLYVYFKNKEEIINMLVLESMKKLYQYISMALQNASTTKVRYNMICRALLKYKEEFPYYFKMTLDKINIDFKDETFEVGEKINNEIKCFLIKGIEEGQIRSDIDIMPTIFSFWGMLSGLILTAENKQLYISKQFNLSKEKFLEYGFDMLYESISTKQEVTTA